MRLACGRSGARGWELQVDLYPVSRARAYRCFATGLTGGFIRWSPRSGGDTSRSMCRFSSFSDPSVSGKEGPCSLHGQVRDGRSIGLSKGNRPEDFFGIMPFDALASRWTTGDKHLCSVGPIPLQTHRTYPESEKRCGNRELKKLLRWISPEQGFLHPGIMNQAPIALSTGVDCSFLGKPGGNQHGIGVSLGNTTTPMKE